MTNIYTVLTKGGVKMAGYWQSLFFFCTIMDLDFISVHEKNKKGMRAISSYLDRNKLDQQRINYKTAMFSVSTL